MKIQELKVLVLKNKKISKDRSMALASVLKHVESKTVGVSWKAEDEEKIVLQSFKKELKEQLQSKESGAPYSKATIAICEQVIKDQSPDVLSEDKVREIVFQYLVVNENAKVGQVMGFLKKTYGESVDMGSASKIVSSTIKEMQ